MRDDPHDPNIVWMTERELRNYGRPSRRRLVLIYGLSFGLGLFPLWIGLGHFIWTHF